MSTQDQCPSTTGKNGKPAKAGKAELHERKRELPRLNGQATGRPYWRSLEEIADTPQFREALEREFPSGASELLQSSRRTFLQLMGASLAMAGAIALPGCRRPDHKILAYSAQVPEEIIPGKPIYYATSMPLPGGGAEGLLIECHEGRPTKVEGNPLHPVNRGKSTVWSQSSVLGLYDPDRVKFPVYRPAPGDVRPATWDDFKVWSAEHFAHFDADGGAGLAFLVEKKSSPTRDAVRDRVRARWPRAQWFAYDAADSSGAAEGTRLAFGRPMRELLSFTDGRGVKAKVILSLGRDFLEAEDPANLIYAREFALTRRPMDVGDEMSRLYVAESGFSLTGGQADHRERVAPSRLPAMAALIASAVLSKAGGDSELVRALAGVEAQAGEDISGAFVEAVADDLIAAGRGHSLVVAGATQPPEVHALAAALNAALGNIGSTVRYLPMGEDLAADSGKNLAALADGIASGGVRTLVMVDTNPVYSAPGVLNFAELFEKITTVHWGVGATESGALATWELNGAHYLESWGDTEAWDGTIAPVQPMIAPLYEPSLSEIEFLALLAGEVNPVGYAIVRDVWREVLGGPGDAGFEKAWRQALHDGVLRRREADEAAPMLDAARVAGALAGLEPAAPPTLDAMDVVFSIGRVADGRFANYAWLQELPQVGTQVVWDNPALVSPATATALGVVPESYTVQHPEGRVAVLRVNGRELRMPFWILPGMADNTVILTVGYGREVCGRVGDGVGWNVYAVRDPSGRRTARGASVEAIDEGFTIASTQQHWQLESRTSLVRQVDLPAWRKFGGDSPEELADRMYGTKTSLPFGERVGGGELTHTPPNINIYEHPFTDTKALEPDEGSVYDTRPQWGMSVDLTTCTGCGACTIACQAENNIPVVGKIEVQKGREMHWIRVDRYFTGENLNTPEEMLHQPVLCVQCENAPCETVCPVNATVHGPEGINYQVYNRCIGTRYCANNCPYKVRRFNFFDYGVKKFEGDYVGKDVLDNVLPNVGGQSGGGQHNRINPNLIPPRLREKLDEIEKMQKNPDVTVRSRGVMEKCTFCIQRINAARIETKLHDLDNIPEGMFQVACAQACPSDAIVFGDLLDPESRAGKYRNHPRAYALLGYLNTRPRVTHMVRVVNPNPRLRTPVEDPFGHHGEHAPHGEGEHGGEPHGPGTNGGHGGEHGGEGGGGHSFFDRRKLSEDRGYAMSLRVLGGARA